MEVGQFYAETFRTLALGLLYAPIYPPSLLLTALAIASSFHATKYGIAHWYRRPPLLGGELMKRMRNALSLLLLLYMVLAVLVPLQRDQKSFLEHGLPLLLILLLLWLAALALAACLSRVPAFSTRAAAEAIAARRTSAASRRMRYDVVTRTTGIIMERYICPSASHGRSAADLEATLSSLSQLGGGGEAGLHPSASALTSRADAADVADAADAADAAYFAEIAAAEHARRTRSGPRSKDPVIRHLEGALDGLNKALLGARGARPFGQSLVVHVEQRPCGSVAKPEQAGDAEEEEEEGTDPPGWPSLRF